MRGPIGAVLVSSGALVAEDYPYGRLSWGLTVHFAPTRL
jgi:hypothetical protein